MTVFAIGLLHARSTVLQLWLLTCCWNCCSAANNPDKAIHTTDHGVAEALRQLAHNSITLDDKATHCHTVNVNAEKSTVLHSSRNEKIYCIFLIRWPKQLWKYIDTLIWLISLVFWVGLLAQNGYLSNPVLFSAVSKSQHCENNAIDKYVTFVQISTFLSESITQ